jgi:hypothetical protein
MKENKNIERLFQEKFKDFEVTPPDFVWENIQEKLHPKEKKRRVIPFWFKTTGIAASFIAIMSVVFLNINTDFKNTNSNNNKNTVVNSETNEVNKNSNQNIENHKINTSESNINQNNSNSSFINETKNNSIVNTNSVNKSSGSKTDLKFNKNSIQKSNTYKTSNSFVSNHKKQSNTNSFKKNKTIFNRSNYGIVINQNNKTKSTKNSLKVYTSNSEIIHFNTSKNNASNSGIADINSIKNSNFNSGLTDINTFNSSNSTSKNNTNNNGILVENDLGNLDTNSTNIVAVEETKIDTTAIATTTIEENPMEKLLREKETKKVADEKEKWSKWAVNSFVSPIFFNSFANGSPLSEEFATNKKTFNNSTSYGVGVSYNVNKRLSVKTGVSNLNLDYDTENIAFYSSFEDQSKISNTNIERNSNGKYLVLKHEKDISKSVIENQMIPSNQNSGKLNQKTQYVEVPLELSYAILNKKIGIAIKGGMSTLFLTENVISISGNDGNMQIGKASNLNNVHFSSNVGLGLSYNFMKNFQVNVEPTLKYQINTFNKNAEDFSPYVIGVNTGISYKF